MPESSVKLPEDAVVFIYLVRISLHQATCSKYRQVIERLQKNVAASSCTAFFYICIHFYGRFGITFGKLLYQQRIRSVDLFVFLASLVKNTIVWGVQDQCAWPKSFRVLSYEIMHNTRKGGVSASRHT